MFGRKTQDSDTVVRLIASQLRRDISVGVLAPDTKLKIDELRQRYGGSAHSFREALTLLASEGIVEASAQRGFRVASATQSDLEDISRLRAEIESLGLGWSIKHGDLRWEGEVLAAFHTYSKLCMQTDADRQAFAIEWDEAGRHFHATLVAACRSPRLIGFQDRLFTQSRRFRYAALVEGSIDLAAETRGLGEVVEATLSRDADRACELLSNQILGALTR
ncbi:GntR family transcriptional regulator [Neoaquamicrobium sediminum]|uniref:GntR family transcriptional regulator n=1 Tax=Neoaquamicrobium sediminum TaxID=1849104 RepID=UPI001566A7AC|nr:GntR family transcriptional regulator [Mesorhizobium sediminum]NRC52733.1 GntR family transcriptional regulator [Mesorhizobium sediminum]